MDVALALKGLQFKIKGVPQSTLNKDITDRPDELFQTLGIAAKWSVNATKDSILFDPCLRKLVNESCGTFLSGQKLSQSLGSGGDHAPDLLKLSRRYRSIIRVCRNNLYEIIESSQQDLGKLNSYYFANVLDKIELIWHLCEILYVDVVPGDIVLPQLLEWIRFHFPEGERKAATILETGADRVEAGFETAGSEKDPEYWKTVIGVLLQGRIDVTRALLVLHSDAKTTPFQHADVCLRTMPLYNIYGGTSVTVFNAQWTRWQADVRSKIEEGVFESNLDLELIMKIIAGDVTVMDTIRNHCNVWYQLMTATLFFSEPTVKSFDLSYHADHAMRAFGSNNDIQDLDKLILLLLESNLLEVIQELQKTADNGWFAVHLTNLLYLCGRLNIFDSNKVNVAHQLHEHVLLDYGTMLMSHHSLWQVGVSYLDHCPPHGLERLEILLPAIPLTSEARAFKIMQMAHERRLDSVVTTICKVMASKSLRQDRLGNALAWALRSTDANLTNHLADRFLEGFADKGEFEATDLLDNLGSCMLVSDRLTFLGKYCEFHQLYKSNNLKAAASLIVSLLSSHLPPKNFQLILLTQCIPLLECRELIFSANDTDILLSCLETLETELLTQVDSCSVSKSLDAATKEKIQLIRFSLARNLSRAIIIEGSDIPNTNSRMVNVS
ncbi:nuclear pore complex protein Nup85 [Frankliniella occidentalis]|uniref:Nuclear pore complex protein Nup85 n=1 Tax=Frankliniella occidentalis TaxID=133901 RepID=A0A6J1SLM5_FRAOC|nr:nuclear pore complex protein Nup85 [Frankliniella occidentalis]